MLSAHQRYLDLPRGSDCHDKHESKHNAVPRMDVVPPGRERGGSRRAYVIGLRDVLLLTFSVSLTTEAGRPQTHGHAQSRARSLTRVVSRRRSGDDSPVSEMQR